MRYPVRRAMRAVAQNAGRSRSRGPDCLRGMSSAPYDRTRLSALRYAVNDEAEHYVAVMLVATEGTAGLLCPAPRRAGPAAARQ